jgi:hypothetical protein
MFGMISIGIALLSTAKKAWYAVKKPIPKNTNTVQSFDNLSPAFQVPADWITAEVKAMSAKKNIPLMVAAGALVAGLGYVAIKKGGKK